MLARPSTSGGPSSRKAGDISFDNYDKRVSRDDFFMKYAGGMGTTSYATSGHGKPLILEEFPQSSTMLRTIPVVKEPRRETPDEHGHGPIGVALGSPSHPPRDYSAQDARKLFQPQLGLAINPVGPLSTSSSPGPYDAAPKKPPSKWKLFGRFGKKHGDGSQTGTSTLGSARTHTEPSTTTRQRSNTTLTRSNSKYKPLVVRSQTMPYGETQPLDAKLIKAKAPWNRFPERNDSLDTLGSSATMPARIGNYDNAPRGSTARRPRPGAASKKTGLLNVEIPSIQMERYSVMFGDILQKQPAPSLLTRRQVTLEELKTITEDAHKDEEESQTKCRRATSPQPLRSPVFNLFPAPPSDTRPAVTPSPRLRSNTSPARMPSPSRASLDTPTNQSHVLTPVVERPSESKVAIVTQQPEIAHEVDHDPRREPNKTPHPEAPRRVPREVPHHETHHSVQHEAHQSVHHEAHFGPGESTLILDSPSDSPVDEEMPDPHFPTPPTGRRPRQHQYQTPVKPPQARSQPQQPFGSSTASSITSSHGRSPSSTSSFRTHMTTPSLDMDEPMTVTERMNPVEISIARQISLSRQQRKMLQPMETKFHTPRTRFNSASAKNGPRIADTNIKVSTPTLVHPPGPPLPGDDPHPSTRKSATGLLDQFDE